MGNSRTFVGAFLLVISILLETIAILALGALDSSIVSPAPMNFELLLIYICGALSGVGIGGVILKTGKGENADQIDLVIGGGGAAGIFAFAIWFWVIQTVHPTGIFYSVIAALLATFSNMLIFASWDI